jgi:hypothetical protein
MDQMKGAADDPEQFRTSRKKPVTVVKANIDDARQRDLRRARQSFAQRERERLGLAPRAGEPERTTPNFDRDLRHRLDKGYSEEIAREMARAGASVDGRPWERPRRKSRNTGGANPTNL